MTYLRKITVLVFSICFANTIYSQNALSFDGVNDAVDCGNNSLLQITGTAITLEAWIYPTAWTNEVWRGGIIVKEQNSSNDGYMFRAGDGGKLNFAIGSGGPWTELTTAAGTLTLNTWQHVAATYDGAKMRLYVNGVPVDSLSTTNTIGNASNTNLNIGAHIPMNRYFIGRIDEARIWDITRTGTEISNSMNTEQCQQTGLVAYYQFNQGVANGTNTGLTTAADSSGNALDGTIMNMALTGSTSNWTNGVVLNPSGDNTGIDVQNACSPFIWIDGNSYTSNNSTATFTVTNSAGCDSVVTLNLTLNGGVSTSSTDVISSCNPIQWIDGNLYFTSNNTASVTIPNAAGCDSVITLDLTIHPTTYGNDPQISCGPFTWIDGNTYTTDNNSATFILTNAAGCDSVVTLNLDIANTFGTDEQVACGSFTWIDGNVYTSNNNTATHVLTNANGCDSTVTLDLTFETLDISVDQVTFTLTALQNGASYQWLDCADDMAPIPGATNQDYVATAIGSYAVEITYYNCVDTSECHYVDAIGIEENSANSNIQLFPNPTTGLVNLSIGDDFENLTVVVRDMTGKIVEQIDFVNGDQTSFELNASNGIYVVEVYSESIKKTIQMVKY